jgi:hypothetical protein
MSQNYCVVLFHFKAVAQKIVYLVDITKESQTSLTFQSLSKNERIIIFLAQLLTY